MRFGWDPEKDKTNRLKHGVSFAEATELFTSGIDYWEIYDKQHSDEEDRFIAVGPIKRGVIVVAYTVLRIVSARMATRRERLRFKEFRKGRS